MKYVLVCQWNYDHKIWGAVLMFVVGCELYLLLIEVLLIH
jgi:hypothetical protein